MCVYNAQKANVNVNVQITTTYKRVGLRRHKQIPTYSII